MNTTDATWEDAREVERAAQRDAIAAYRAEAAAAMAAAQAEYDATH